MANDLFDNLSNQNSRISINVETLIVFQKDKKYTP